MVVVVDKTGLRFDSVAQRQNMEAKAVDLAQDLVARLKAFVAP